MDERRLAAFVRELTVVGLRTLSRFRREHPERAEDLVSDALLRLWDKYGAAITRRELPLLAREMVKTVRNLVINEYEAIAARRRLERSLAVRHVGPAVTTPLEDYECGEFLQVYERALAEMPEELREVWVALVDGRKAAAVAAQYGLSAGAVEKRRQRADAFLRPRIEAAGYRWLPRSSKASKDGGGRMERATYGTTAGETDCTASKARKVAESPPPRYDATGPTSAEEDDE